MMPSFAHTAVLTCHPETYTRAVQEIEVRVGWTQGNALAFTYAIKGNVMRLRIPLPRQPRRADRLWQHTCFEAFVSVKGKTEYYEFNFAPSTRWAAYWFDSYRSGMRLATEISAPRVEVQSSRACYRAALEMDQMSRLRIDGKWWRIGLAAVIEETSGHKSYWALAHPPGKADFHQSESFVLEFS